MKQFVFNTIFIPISYCLNQLIKLKIFFNIYNYLYERMPYGIIRLLVKTITLPNKDAEWTILLKNNKTIRTKIYKGNFKTSQFALSYKWHSPSLNTLEYKLIKFFPKNTPWIDVGANLGLRSLLALSENNPVYFIEPNNELNNLNNARCILNNFNNFTFINCGASNTKRQTEFYIDKSSYNSSLEKSYFDNALLERREIIQINTLDNIFSELCNSWDHAIIKIDVEGHEIQVIEGAMKLIQRFSPVFIVEVNKKDNHINHFCSLMWSNNYDIFEIGNFDSNKILRKLHSNTNSSSTYSGTSNDFLSIKNKEFEKNMEVFIDKA